MLSVLLILAASATEAQAPAAEAEPHQCIQDFRNEQEYIWVGVPSVPNYHVGEFVPPGGQNGPGTLDFYWTMSGQKHPNYQACPTNLNFDPLHWSGPFHFNLPDDKTITDWTQVIKSTGGSSQVSGGNIKRGSDAAPESAANSPLSPWSFQPLEDLPLVPWRIPDLAPTRDNLTIYTAVNLDLYLRNNPFGFLQGQWQFGQTLDQLLIEIVNGRISGLDGILWATSEFVFDPLSPDGFVSSGGSESLLNSTMFQEQHGPITILSEHFATVPEPSTLALVGTGVLGLLGYSYRSRRTRSAPSEKRWRTRRSFD